MKEKRTKITEVLALLTLTVFAMCVLLVLLMGASAYRGLVDAGEESHGRRTAVGYLTTRVRQAESVELEPFQGYPSLLLQETVGGDTYVTRIYCWDGWLRELYSAPGAGLSVEDGEEILETDAFSCTLEGDLLTLSVGQDTVCLHLPVNGEVAS